MQQTPVSSTLQPSPCSSNFPLDHSSYAFAHKLYHYPSPLFPIPSVNGEPQHSADRLFFELVPSSAKATSTPVKTWRSSHSYVITRPCGTWKLFLVVLSRLPPSWGGSVGRPGWCELRARLCLCMTVASHMASMV